MPLVFANNTFSTIGSPLAPSDVIINLGPGQGTFWQWLTDAQHFSYATLIHVADNTLEIVKINGPITADVLPVLQRGADGTTPKAFSAGDRIEVRIPRAALNAMILEEEFQSMAPLRPVVSGIANAVTAVHTPPFPLLSQGLTSIFVPIAGNTGPATYAPDGLTPDPIVKFGGVPIGAGDLVIGIPAWVMFSTIIGGGSWILLNPQSSPLPTGSMIDFGGTVAPAGFLLCDGASYDRTVQAGLFQIIGVTYGSADGTHFNVPNFARRVAVGSGGTTSATLANTVGAVGGEETHTLQINETPVHTHTEKTQHTHITRSNNSLSSGFQEFQSVPMGNTPGNVGVQTSFAGVGTSLPFNLASSGSGAAHNNIQPSMVVLKIIKS